MQLTLELDIPNEPSLASQLAGFNAFDRATIVAETSVRSLDRAIPVYVNEFWTARQRAAHSLHEISYRACFKPQLPRFFIDRLTRRGDVVHDPFMGRGTTPLEAALLGRIPSGCDVNPLSAMLVAPRLDPPTLVQVAKRLAEIDWDYQAPDAPNRDDLLAFFHPRTLQRISALQHHLQGRILDSIDAWIRLVALNRLTGHSPGFFSVYTMPPNQAVSAQSQRKINARRNQTPPERDVAKIILKKTRSLLADCTAAERKMLRAAAARARLLASGSASTPQIPSNSVALVVTSPPFLDVVDYGTDNWLRCWFCGIDPATVPITICKKIEGWEAAMTAVLREQRRILKPGGHVAFEVGEVRGGTLKLEEHVLACAVAAGLEPLFIVINQQNFTKTANCWGVDNNAKGTNTNRIVVMRKPE